VVAEVAEEAPPDLLEPEADLLGHRGGVGRLGRDLEQPASPWTFSQSASSDSLNGPSAGRGSSATEARRAHHRV
jgi:hypothetical protein